MELRWYQSEACNATWHYLCQGQQAGNPVIVLPTGAGKSLVIADLCRVAVEQYQGRVIVLAHRKELLQQNAEKIQKLLPHIKIDTYSAGLKRYGTEADIVVAGIQSVYKKAFDFGRRNLILIDECHLIPNTDDGMYRTFLTQMAEVNPKLRMVGLTATPFRTGEGSLCGVNNMFQKICYSAPLQKLIAEGFLCEITSENAKASVDTSGLHIRAGEFRSDEVERLFDSRDVVDKACAEIIEKTRDRKSIMVFCSGVMHAGDVAEKIEQATGERVGLITGESSDLERAGVISDFRSRRLRWLINVDVLTTGFDAPCVDAIAVLRATMSPGLFAQICGRGLRTFADKPWGCMILDFGENIKRHGALDDPEYGMKQKRKFEREEGEDREPQANEKRCPGCDEIVAANLRVCECGYKFPVKHQENSSSEQILSKPVKWYVDEVRVSRHRKKAAKEDAPDTLRVDYVCQCDEAVEWKPSQVCHSCTNCHGIFSEKSGKVTFATKYDGELRCPHCDEFYNFVSIPCGNLAEQTISEWVCLEHPPGYALTKAKIWWQAHSNAELPLDIDNAIDLFNRGAIGMPTHITTIKEGHFHRITLVEGIEKPTAWSEPQPEYEGEVDEWGNAIEDEMPF